MANQFKNVNGQHIELTDSEQAELDALKKANPNISDDMKKQIKRLERNGLLIETDWMALSDVTMTDAWKTYRQALRDLPAKSGFPDVDFPTKPS
jgi:hypothetical protein